MARLAARAKLLYYPTPASVVDKISSYFHATAPYRVCDPCAGTGEALTGLVTGIGQADVETWGIELSYSRAAEAEEKLDKVLPVSFYSVRWGSRTTSMIFNNPPYDWSQREDTGGRKIRHERLFVIESTPRLVDGGHQIIIIPQEHVGR